MALVKRIVLGALVAGSAALGILIAFLTYLQLSGNFHTVLPGELYRSAQVSPEQIATHRTEQGIRSILNLRGAYPGEAWYDDEISASAAQGIVHADFKLSASTALSPDEVTRLIALMRDLPKPLLIHCRSGADRTGLAASLYLADIAGKGEDEAEAQLSIRFGHFSIPYLSDAYPMDETWERMEKILGYGGS